MQGEHGTLLEQGSERGADEEGGDVVSVTPERVDKHVPAAGDQKADGALVHEKGPRPGLPEGGADGVAGAGGECLGNGAAAHGDVRWFGGADGGGLRERIEGERDVGAHVQAVGTVGVRRAAHGTPAHRRVR